MCLEKKITLKWFDPREFDDLFEFFKNNEKGGLYFWIHKGKPSRIRYIGEAEIFRNRFCSHIQNITHGLYTAIKCGADEDLKSKYEAIIEMGEKADQQNGSNSLCYHPKPINFSNNYYKKEYLKKYIEDIRTGTELSLEGFLNCKFIFAEILYKGEPADKHLRKEIEAIFMKITHEKYTKGAKWCNFKRTNFWGSISENNKKDCKYIFKNEYAENKKELNEAIKDLGINDETWEYHDSGEQ